MGTVNERKKYDPGIGSVNETYPLTGQNHIQNDPGDIFPLLRKCIQVTDEK